MSALGLDSLRQGNYATETHWANLSFAEKPCGSPDETEQANMLRVQHYHGIHNLTEASEDELSTLLQVKRPTQQFYRNNKEPVRATAASESPHLQPL